MIKSVTNIRVRYSEIDKMNYIYYSRYLEYFEIARADWLNEHMLTYSVIETKYNIFLPVVECNINYYKSASYNDLITIYCSVDINSISKEITFHYVVKHEEVVLVKGLTKHLFFDSTIKKVVEIPMSLKSSIR